VRSGTYDTVTLCETSPHIYGHDVMDDEVEAVLTDPGEDRPR
jgi:hypothetical protein